MRLVLRFFAIVVGVWLVRRAGVQVGVTPVLPAAAAAQPSAPLPMHSDVAQIVSLMVADPEIGLVLQTNAPGEPLRGIRFTGPGGQA